MNKILLLLILSVTSVLGGVVDMSSLSGPTFPICSNSNGQTVGFYAVGLRNHGFLYNGHFTDINPGGAESYANGINSQGVVVGSFSDENNLVTRGFIYKQGTVIVIPDPYGIYTSAESINDQGDVVGTTVTANHYRAFLFRKGVFYDLNTLINDPAWELTEATYVDNQGHIYGKGNKNGLPKKWMVTL